MDNGTEMKLNCSMHSARNFCTVPSSKYKNLHKIRISKHPLYRRRSRGSRRVRSPHPPPLPPKKTNNKYWGEEPPPPSTFWCWKTLLRMYLTLPVTWPTSKHTFTFSALRRLANYLRPRPHISGDFCIRKFFYADTKKSASTCSVYESYMTVHTYPIRIRTSQRISQQRMENLARKKTGSDTVTSAYKKSLRIRASTRIRIQSVYRNFHSGERIQKSPDTPSVYGGHVWTLGVSAWTNLRIQKSPDTCGRSLRSTMNQDRLKTVYWCNVTNRNTATLDTVKIAKKFACANEQREGHFGEFE